MLLNVTVMIADQQDHQVTLDVTQLDQVVLGTWYLVLEPSHQTRVTNEQDDKGGEGDIEDGRLARTPEYTQS